MFKFGFSNSDDEKNDDSKIVTKQWFKAQKYEINNELLLKIKECEYKLYEINDLKLKYVSSSEVINKLKDINDSCIVRAEKDHSDLVTAEYEGGLKIWECTNDLINYLQVNKVDFKNKKVLDLGCGAGLLGIYTLVNESLVDFQDYNKEVIEYTTFPTVVLNVNNKLNCCNFYYGDWESFIPLVNSKYDFILTSETIYNPENYRKLYNTFENLLEDNGIIFLAAKTHYFGVGGNTRQFEEIIKNKFSSTVVWTNLEGVQREIIKIVKIKK